MTQTKGQRPAVGLRHLVPPAAPRAPEMFDASPPRRLGRSNSAGPTFGRIVDPEVRRPTDLHGTSVERTHDGMSRDPARTEHAAGRPDAEDAHRPCTLPERFPVRCTRRRSSFQLCCRRLGRPTREESGSRRHDGRPDAPERRRPGLPRPAETQAARGAPQGGRLRPSGRRRPPGGFVPPAEVDGTGPGVPRDAHPPPRRQEGTARSGSGGRKDVVPTCAQFRRGTREPAGTLLNDRTGGAA
jgi:hypothetical protein